MRDERLSKLADVLADHSLEIKPGENVIIRSHYQAKPLIDAFYTKVTHVGANAFVHVIMDDHKKHYMENASEAQLESMNDSYGSIYDRADAVLCIEAPENVKYLAGVSPERIVAYNKALAPVLRTITDKRWVLTNYPTHAFAQEADMSLEEYEDFLFDAALVDYKKMDMEMNRVLERFDSASKVRIIGRDTDLTFDIQGRSGTKCSGQNNIPDGEVYYAPITNSVNGHIYYEFPVIRYGNQVDAARLEFKEGRVVSAKADKNETFLNKILDTDAGARYLGEFGIGMNYGITRFIKNILFDEKIGGTIHLAVGNAYEGSGGDNRSSIHWDMIKELRDCGEIYLDDILVQKNGVFLFE